MAKKRGIVNWAMRRLHAPIYASRLDELVRRITPCLRKGDRVLDVGCGFGGLGRAIMDDPACPAGVEVVGLERVKRERDILKKVVAIFSKDPDRYSGS